jgi:hypothetical protein
MAATPSDATFLEEVLFALGRRRKAIRYRVRDLDVQRTTDEDSEKLSIECKPMGVQRTIVRLFVWPDRWIWIDARKSSKNGWVWQFTMDGRLAGGLAAEDLIKALEGSISASQPVKDAAEKGLDKLWKPLLAQGPRPIS